MARITYLSGTQQRPQICGNRLCFKNHSRHTIRELYHMVSSNDIIATQSGQWQKRFLDNQYCFLLAHITSPMAIVSYLTGQARSPLFLSVCPKYGSGRYIAPQSNVAVRKFTYLPLKSRLARLFGTASRAAVLQAHSSIGRNDVQQSSAWDTAYSDGGVLGGSQRHFPYSNVHGWCKPIFTQ